MDEVLFSKYKVVFPLFPNESAVQREPQKAWKLYTIPTHQAAAHKHSGCLLRQPRQSEVEMF